MEVKIIVSDGLAHYSYLIGAGGEAAIVDPSRDIDRYLKAATLAGFRITRIFETHRNEDYISGACELAQRTGAKVWRGRSPDFDVPYAETVSEGQAFEFGDVRLSILETPGHTDDSISIVLSHLESGEAPAAVFTGDALFFGDVGRTDFYPDRAREVAGLLYDSLHDKLLALGDGVVLYPAHGGGSVCGSGIAMRDVSSIGYERMTNPRLQLKREEFIDAKVAEHHYMPPYFSRMEAANAGKEPALGQLPIPAALSIQQVGEAIDAGAQLLDLRTGQAIAGACIKSAVSIPLDMLASFGGWFLESDRPIVLLPETSDDLDEAVRTLVRIGYERIDGFVADGINGWTTNGRPLGRLEGHDVHQLKASLDSAEPPQLIDVRSIDEYEAGHIGQAMHCYVGQIKDAVASLAIARPVITYCASGERALVAAAALVRLGCANVSVCWGSMGGWQAAGYPVTEGKGK